MELFFPPVPLPPDRCDGQRRQDHHHHHPCGVPERGGIQRLWGGNIGKPLLPDVPAWSRRTLRCWSCPSFQLMTMEQSPHIAVIPICPQPPPGLPQIHGGVYRPRSKIFLHQGEEDRAIFNYDNQLTRDLAERPGAVTFFSRRERPEEGVYLRDGGHLAHQRPGQPGGAAHPGHPAARGAQHRKLHGGHRRRGRTGAGQVRPAAARFQGGAPHRAAWELDGVKYYNDSIGTSPSRTVACLESFPEPVILIAGGYDKGIPFHALAWRSGRGQDPGLTGHGLTTGRQWRRRRAAAAARRSSRLRGPGRAVEAAWAAGRGTWWCCPPACAAFDRFKNFMGRGRAFRSWSGPCDRKHKGGTLSWIMMRYFPACAAWAPPADSRGRRPGRRRSCSALWRTRVTVDRMGSVLAPAPVRQGGGEAAAAGRPSGRDRLCGHRP